MRILLAGPLPGQMSGGPAGGVGEAVALVAATLARAGAHDVHVAVPGGAPALPGTTTHASVRDVRGALLTRFPRYRASLAEIVRDVRPDVIHAHGALAHGYAAVAVSGGVPVVLTVHGSVEEDTVHEVRRPGDMVRRALARSIAADAISRADVVTDVVRDYRVNLPFARREVLYVPNPVSDRWWDVARDPEPRRVLYAGGSRAVKGWRVLARAWGLMDSPGRLVVCGWDGDPAPFEAEYPRAGGSVVFRPTLGADELAAEFAAASVLVVPSLFEVAPLVVLQAWAAGLPVVCTSAGGMAEFGPDSVCRVPPGDPVALSAAISRVLDEPGFASSLASSGRKAAEGHRADAVTAAYVAVYESLAEGGAR